MHFNLQFKNEKPWSYWTLTWVTNDANEPVSVLVDGNHDEVLVEEVNLNKLII